MKIVDRVRSRIQEFRKPFSASDLRGVLPDVSLDQIRIAIDYLVRDGEIISVTRGEYRPVGTVKPRDYGVGKVRILRAIHIKNIFSVNEVVALADVSMRNVQRTVNKLLDAGHIELCGRQKGPSGYPERVFRVRNRDVFYLKYILPNTKL